MNILISVDPEIPVPPSNYGGIERIVDSLSTFYTSKGHRVTLLSNPSSTCSSATNLVGWKGRASQNKIDTIKNSLQLLNTIKRYNIDAVHSFSRLLYLFPTILTKKTKIIQTYQREIDNSTTHWTKRIAGDKISFTACAGHMLKKLSIKKDFTPIYNFSDTDYFKPGSTAREDFLFFLGRIQDTKGVHEAILVAQQTNSKLIIAGNIPDEHKNYFNSMVKPFLNNDIKYIGPVNDEQKLDYLQRSKAMLFPIKWEEPFGIVMAEAMACGCPVIGFKRGSVDEVIQNGINGFKVNNIDEMAESIPNLNSIDSNTISQYAKNHFSLEVIGKQYLELFKKMID